MADNRIAYGLAKKYGIDTRGMSPKEVWEALKGKGITQANAQEKYSAQSKKREKAEKIYNSDGIGGEHIPTPAEKKRLDELGIDTGDYSQFALKDKDSIEVYNKIKSGKNYTIAELENLPVFNRIQEEAEKSRQANAKRLGMPDEYKGYTIMINTPVREKAREGWINDFVEGKGVETRPKTPLRKENKFTIVVGLPASGKSSRIANPLSEEQGAFIFDSDEMKKLIDGFDGGKNADGVHEESKTLLERAQNRFINGDMKGTNIVYPVIGDNYGKLVKKIQPFKDAGYNVEIAYKKADTEQSMNRVLSRAIKDGRYIPKKVVMKYNNDNIVRAYNEALKNGVKKSKYSEL